MYLTKKNGHGFYHRLIVPLGAGLIVGEAILGIGHAGFEMLF